MGLIYEESITSIHTRIIYLRAEIQHKKVDYEMNCDLYSHLNLIKYNTEAERLAKEIEELQEQRNELIKQHTLKLLHQSRSAQGSTVSDEDE